MRRSSIVQLTLLPLLASSAIASADITDDPPPIMTPSMTSPMLMPPGMTPTIDELSCDDDPNWQQRPDCQETVVDTYVVRGGYGGYFWSGGG